jgi:hypothetical protein
MRSSSNTLEKRKRELKIIAARLDRRIARLERIVAELSKSL